MSQADQYGPTEVADSVDVKYLKPLVDITGTPLRFEFCVSDESGETYTKTFKRENFLKYTRVADWLSAWVGVKKDNIGGWTKTLNALLGSDKKAEPERIPSRRRVDRPLFLDHLRPVAEMGSAEQLRDEVDILKVRRDETEIAAGVLEGEGLAGDNIAERAEELGIPSEPVALPDGPEVWVDIRLLRENNPSHSWTEMRDETKPMHIFGESKGHWHLGIDTATGCRRVLRLRKRQLEHAQELWRNS